MNKLEDFYAKYRRVTYKKGEIILAQGAVPSTAFAVKSGVVRLYTFTSEYAERSVSFVVSGEVLPICWLFSKTATTLFYYVAHTDCELHVIDRQAFQKEIMGSSAMSYALLDDSINDYVTKALQITALEQTRAIDRILHTFNYFCLRYGRRLMNDVVRIDIPLTQKDIASFTGLARETVAVEMSKVRKKRIFTCKNRLYTVNLTNLRAFIEDMQGEDVTIMSRNKI